jgi:hypothetical protein
MSDIRIAALLLGGFAVWANAAVAAPPPPRVAGAADQPLPAPQVSSPMPVQPATITPVAAPAPAAMAAPRDYAPPPQAVPAKAGEQGAPSLGGPRLGFMLAADMEFGGDSVAKVLFTDGDDQDVDAGQGVTLGGGVYWRQYAEQGFELRGTLGYKFVFTAASNADIRLTRYVGELTGGYRFAGGTWIGTGPVRHMSIKLNADDFGDNMEFDDATGYTIEVGWRWIKAVYTDIDYKIQGHTFDASNFGVGFNWQF